jgi:hypothetical protein
MVVGRLAIAFGIVGTAIVGCAAILGVDEVEFGADAGALAAEGGEAAATLDSSAPEAPASDAANLPTVFATGQSPRVLVVDDASVVWTNGSAPYVLGCSVAGCGPNGPYVVQAAGPQALDVALSGGAVYYSYDGGINRCDAGPCASPANLVYTVNASSFVVGPYGSLVTADATKNVVEACDPSSCSLHQDDDVAPFDPHAMVVSNDIVAWMTPSSLYYCTIADPSGQCVTVVTQLGVGHGGPIASDRRTLYFAELDTQTIRACPAAACGSENKAVLAMGTKAAGLATDGLAIYWTVADDGTVHRRSLADGGVNETIAIGQGGPGAIAVGASDVFWANTAAGTVMRMPK